MSHPESLNLGAKSEPAFDRAPAAVPLDRETLLARFDGILQFAGGGPRRDMTFRAAVFDVSNVSPSITARRMAA